MFEPAMLGEVVIVGLVATFQTVIASVIVQRAHRPSPAWEILAALVWVSFASAVLHGPETAAPYWMLVTTAIAAAIACPAVTRGLVKTGLIAAIR